MAFCSKVLESRRVAEERAGLYCLLVLPTMVEGLDIHGEVIDVPTGDSEGFICPEECCVIHLLSSVLKDQSMSFAQHGAIVDVVN